MATALRCLHHVRTQGQATTAPVGKPGVPTCLSVLAYRFVDTEKRRQQKRRAWKKWYLANREKHNEHVRRHARRTRQETFAWYTALKTTLACQDCGYNKHPQALDFDHRPGVVKSFTI